MKANKKHTRIRRSKRVRGKIRELDATKLTVHRTPRHMYAQVIEQHEGADRVLASASTVEADIRKKGATGNKDAAALIGKLVAERAIKAGIKQVAFDRSGFNYHGRVKAFADAAREGGLEF